MNIQIFGRGKCFDTKKAERYFKERRIPFQRIDMDEKGMSPRELERVCAAVGGLEKLINEKHPDAVLLRHLAYPEDRAARCLEDPRLLKTPVVRSGARATVGYAPEVWKTWE